MDASGAGRVSVVLVLGIDVLNADLSSTSILPTSTWHVVAYLSLLFWLHGGKEVDTNDEVPRVFVGIS